MSLYVDRTKKRKKKNRLVYRVAVRSTDVDWHKEKCKMMSLSQILFLPLLPDFCEIRIGCGDAMTGIKSPAAALMKG